MRLVAAAKKNGVRRFIYLSGAGAGRGRMETWFQAKQMAENAIRESGMEYVIFRPSWIYRPPRPQREPLRPHFPLSSVFAGHWKWKDQGTAGLRGRRGGGGGEGGRFGESGQ